MRTRHSSTTGLIRDLALALGLVAYVGGKWLRAGARGRGRLRDRNGTMGRLRRRAPGPRILAHGVSVGETHALEPFVEALAGSPLEPDVVVSASTATGFERACRIHAGRREVVRFPLDFTWMVARFLDGVRPELVALAESELWPTFLEECARRSIPVCVVNGRLSNRGYAGYRRWSRLTRRIFRRLAWVSAQTEAYRHRFVALGVPADRVVVGGSLKWDVAPGEPDRAKAEAVAAALGIDSDKPLIVAGSTGPGEEEALLRGLPGGCQLLLAPRRPERWDEVAGLVEGMPRRSRGGTRRRSDGPHRVFLLDTIGELAAAYRLADAVFAGRSLFPMGGSNPLEAVALGKPAVIGPHHENFAGVVADLVAEGGVVVSADPMAVVAGWIENPDAAEAVVAGGRRALKRHRGGAARAAEAVVGLLR